MLDDKRRIHCLEGQEFWSKVYIKHKNREKNARISKRNYHVTEVDEKKEPRQFDLSTYFIDPYPKKYDAFGASCALPHPLWSVSWSWSSRCKKNSMLLWVLQRDNINWMGRRERTSTTASIQEECKLKVRLSLLRDKIVGKLLKQLTKLETKKWTCTLWSCNYYLKNQKGQYGEC